MVKTFFRKIRFVKCTAKVIFNVCGTYEGPEMKEEEEEMEHISQKIEKPPGLRLYPSLPLVACIFSFLLLISAWSCGQTYLEDQRTIHADCCITTVYDDKLDLASEKCERFLHGSTRDRKPINWWIALNWITINLSAVGSKSRKCMRVCCQNVCLFWCSLALSLLRLLPLQFNTTHSVVGFTISSSSFYHHNHHIRQQQHPLVPAGIFRIRVTFFRTRTRSYS